MYPCVIMHNMIIKDEKNVRLQVCFDITIIAIKCSLTIDEYTHGSRKIENPNVHCKLCNHWAFVGSKRQQWGTMKVQFLLSTHPCP
jgi:hypothetical protein